MNEPASHDRRWSAKLRWFAAEFLVVVTGIMVALSLDAFFQRQYDAKSETVYLGLLSRDLGARITALEEIAEFEAKQYADGRLAYQLISQNGSAGAERASRAMQRLTVRRTLRLPDATYQDLISTGNLPLIQNRQLRDRIIDYFENTQRAVQIIDRNNAFFVDDIYVRTLLTQGLIMPRATMSNLPDFVAMDSMFSIDLGNGYVREPDRLWGLPATAPEWAQVKYVLLSRIRATVIAQKMIADLLDQTNRLRRELDAERGQ